MRSVPRGELVPQIGSVMLHSTDTKMKHSGYLDVGMPIDE
ncbi:hypothetical protein [Alloactinosynnema sp. L-07]|nr:hypothetical protein [Alloactinosynnema sp. L-07]